ncbi:MAG: endolytic transglycosylase MltG [Enterovibrio sp.]
MRKKLKIALQLSVIAAIAATGWAGLQVQSFINSPIKLTQATFITVPEGTNYNLLTRKLAKEGILEATLWSRLAGRIIPQLQQLKAGTYRVQPNILVWELFEQLRSGKEHQFSITFIEGSTFSQWRTLIASAPYLKQTLDGEPEASIAQQLGFDSQHAEGRFLPETYHYVAGESDLSILRRAARALDNSVQKIWAHRDPSLPISSPYELLILASIVEKETAIAHERGKVASVFVNRLRKKMRLQTDPTVIYGMGDAYAGNIRKKDLQTFTPYNTYMIPALPPTPIAMPSAASIQAAAKPEATPYHYFVADGKGGHVFSATLTEHNRAVAAYLKELRSKEK